MNHLTFTPTMQESYPVCFLVPKISRDEIKKAYIDSRAIDPKSILVLDLHYGPNKKTPKRELKAFFEEEVVSVLNEFHVKYLVVADAEYFKLLTNVGKVDVNLGYVLPCVLGPWKVIYVPNYRTIFYDPVKVTAKINQGMEALVQYMAGTYTPPGSGILTYEAYPRTLEAIKADLDWLLLKDEDLSIDIETFHLKATKAGIATIAFSWNQNEGIAFPVDYHEIVGATEAPFGTNQRNEAVRDLLRSFFKEFLRKAIYHSAAFDITVLIYQLYMSDILDTEGLLHGLEILCVNFDCTKLISYLATNSCAGNKLSLKDQAQEFAGNYGLGEDIKDVTNIPLDKLLRYNLVDSCSNWYVRAKHWDTMVRDQQLDIYETLFKPSTLDIIQMQLTGLPVDMNRVIEVKAQLEAEIDIPTKAIEQSRIGQAFTKRLNEKWVEKKNTTLKVKRVTLADAKEVFNINSDPQKQDLIYGMLKLPVMATTDSGQPSIKAKHLAELKLQTKDPEIHALLDAFIEHSTIATVLETFIPAMLDATPGPDGWHYLCGNFNLGGALSGRLSSSDPNLQNIPAGGTGGRKAEVGKLIKSCFKSALGWILVGLDFFSLEDRISALTTKDPNKLKVYTDGYDGHSLRAYSYWPSKMPDIDPNDVESINSIAVKYKPIRNRSKTPTFALTYDGTYITLMAQGFSKEEAKQIEASFKELYKVSIQWVQGKLDQASKDGYITAAFGLRVRTPLLAQVIRKTSKTPHEAEAEGRSAGNALGQSWCLLNNRAWVEFMGKVRKSKYRLDIRPCAQIHDAGYALVRDDVETLAWMNEHLVKAVQWQEHPDIAHDQVKLGGELSIFWPNWTKEITIPNGAKEDEITECIEAALAK